MGDKNWDCRKAFANLLADSFPSKAFPWEALRLKRAETGDFSWISAVFCSSSEMFLLEESTSTDDLKDYIDHLLKVSAPGTRFIASIGDTTPPNAVFDRLLYIGERIETLRYLVMSRPRINDTLSQMRQLKMEKRFQPVDDTFGY